MQAKILYQRIEAGFGSLKTVPMLPVDLDYACNSSVIGVQA